jgi:sodium/bile acid cotransporter 7
MRRLLPDRFTLALLGTVVLASLWPCHGDGAKWFGGLADLAIALLFFLHGAKLSRRAALAGFAHWRLHLVVLVSTFALFPLLGVLARPWLASWLTPDFYRGVLFLCLLPSTVQSSIAFTSIARGNVPAAICAASASSLIGILLTPLLAGWLVHVHGQGISLHAVGGIVAQLLLPFVAGQWMQRWIGDWVEAHRRTLALVDQGSILLVVYGAFSAAVVEGLWRHTPLHILVLLAACDAALLGVVLLSTRYGARALGFSREDEITIVFCGSKKSLASGIPMAKVLFSAPTLGAIVLPLMLFHQIQLFTCAVLARRYAKERAAAPATAAIAAG